MELNSIKTENKMGTMKEGRLLLSMAWPIIISMLVQACYNIVDSMFVSRIPLSGELGLTALGYAYPVQMLMISFGVGTAVGINSLVSRRLGAKQFDEANTAAGNGMVLMAATSLVFAAVGAFLSEPLFQLFTDDTSIAALGSEYLRIVCLFSFGLFMQLCLERIMVAQGKSLAAMIMQLTGAVLNIALDRVMVLGWWFVPAMGVRGAAVATVVSQALAMLLSFAILFGGKHEIRISMRTLRLCPKTVKAIYQVGAPSVLMQAISVVMLFVMNGILGAYGTVVVGVFGVYYKLQSIVFMPVFGMTNAAMSIMAYNFGARRRARLIRVLKLSVLYAVCFMTCGMVVFQLFPSQLMSLFQAEGQMLTVGIGTLRTISLSFIPAAISICFSVCFGAIGLGTNSMLVSLVRQFLVLLPAAYLLSHIYGSVGAVWWAFPVSEVCACLFACVVFLSVYRKRIRLLDDCARPAPI